MRGSIHESSWRENVVPQEAMIEGYALYSTLFDFYTPNLYLISLRTFKSSAATASPISDVEANLAAPFPAMSFVRTPASIVLRTASSTAVASAERLREYFSIIATERIVPMGLTIPFPEMSGADPVFISSCLCRVKRTEGMQRHTMNRLINPITLPLPIRNSTQARTWQKTNRSRNHARLITNYISKKITRNDDPIQRLRVPYHKHSRRVNQMMSELQLRELLLHNLREHLPPQPTRRQHIRLIQTPNRHRRLTLQR